MKTYKDLDIYELSYNLAVGIEEPRSKLQGMFCLAAVLRGDRKERCHFMIRSLTLQQATGNALAIAVHELSLRLPKYEIYEQGSQIRRASKGVTSCIVEGYGRRRYKEAN